MAEEAVKISPITDKEIDDLLNMSGAESVIIPNQSDDKNPLKRQADFDADLDIAKTGAEENEDEKKSKEEKKDSVLEDVLNLGDTDNNEKVEEQSAPASIATLNAINKLVKEEKILLFEGDKPLNQYTEKEVAELLEANLQRVSEETAEKVPAEFFDNLPPQLQYAAKYFAEGGEDFKSLFKYLAQSEEIKSLDITTEVGQEQTIRQYLTMTEYGTPEEIEAELASIKDMPGQMEKKAAQFKPKLDAKQQQIIEKQIRDQEVRAKQQQEQAVKYRETVLKAIQPGDLNGVKITPTIQNMLFNGLTQANYPSVSGRNTNLLGHLLEKYNYVEPNPALIAEALWLLKDRKAYHEAIGAKAVEGEAGKTFQTLKTAGKEKTVSNTGDNTHVVKPTKTIKKPTANIFART